MQLGFIGLGKMGGFMVERLLRDKHEIFAFDLSDDAIKNVVGKGAQGASSIEDMCKKLKSPKAVWIMVPAGKPVDDTIEKLIPLMSPGDMIIDGGNSYYKDSQKRYEYLKGKKIHFMDVGTSGGVWGLKVGYCMMIGGDKQIFQHLEPLFKTLGPLDGYGYMGASGTGHLVKMVHNGIEYGMMQAYAEGFEILKATPYGLNMHQISKLWNQGSVVRSWLLELAELAFKEDPNLDKLKGWVADSGEGRWTIQEAIDRDVAAPVITLSLFERFHSRNPDSFSAKVLAALRNQFGGHAVKTK